MAPNPRVASAFRAMRSIGIIEEKVKPVLKYLLKLYDKNWELIEDENYRVLADAIFESEEAEAVEPEKKNQNTEQEEGLEEEAQVDDEPERPLKRLRLRNQESQASPSLSNSAPELGETLLKKPKVEDELPKTCPEARTESPQSNMENTSGGSSSFSVQPLVRNKGKQPVSPKPLEVHERSELSQPDATERYESVPSPIRRRDKGKEILSLSPPGTHRERRPISERSSHPVRLREVNIEPGIILLPKQRIPTTNSVIEPEDAPFTDDMLQCEVPISVIHPEALCNGNSSIENGFIRELDGSEALASRPIEIENKGDDARASSVGTMNKCEIATVAEKSAVDMELASLPPHAEETINATPATNLLEKSKSTDPLDGSMDIGSTAKAAPPQSPILQSSCNNLNDCSEQDKNITGICSELDKSGFEDTNSHSLVAVQRHQLSPNNIRSLPNANDIAKGQERVVISFVNEVNSEGPPSFRYIPRNVVFQSAYVNFSLARIGDNRCCPTCFGNCLSSSTPCACARETGGDFAYTLEGLVKEDLLEECISMNRDPEKHCHFYCEECPLERSKNEDTLEPCKGHLVRKFIKECWWKCGCNKQCGNRVVQRGINRKLQVFMTGEGKGWGLRTLEDLPKGAFVCEYVGEVLTNAELYERVSKSPSSEEHAYPVLLDADWGSEGVLKDEEALCLDATYYGNVARFINHRCFDSNLVEIPVEVETPDHHYYHLAFFTTKKVAAMEELTWDYGIDFDDDSHPVKAFRCRCGSKDCRNIKTSSTTITKRKKSASSPATSKTKQTTTSEGTGQASNCLPRYRSNMSAMENLMEAVQLKKSHKTALQKTPFWDFFEAFISNKVHPSNCKKSDKLVVEILKTYKPERKAFELGGKIVNLGPTDISLIFGISSGKNPMSLSYGKKPNTSFTVRRFPNTKRLTAPLIKDKLLDALQGNKKNDIEDAARLLCLYLCLNLSFATRGNSIGWAFIHYVENLDEMKNYAWSETICNLMMSSIEKSYHSPGQVIGCVAVLPFWLCEHTTIIQPLNQTQYPRFVKWDLGELHKVLTIRGLNSLTKPEVLEVELNMREQVENSVAIEGVAVEVEEVEEEAIKRTRSQTLSGAKSKTTRR